jgi:hypothetical protein
MSKTKKQAMAETLGPLCALLAKSFNLTSLVIVAEDDDTSMVVVPEDAGVHQTVDALLRATLVRGSEELEPLALHAYLVTCITHWLTSVAEKDTAEARAAAAKGADDIIKGMKK